MLLIAALGLWTVACIAALDIMRNLRYRRQRDRYDLAVQLIRETPYLRRLGVRPPELPRPVALWALGFALWALGCFTLAGGLLGGSI